VGHAVVLAIQVGDDGNIPLTQHDPQDPRDAKINPKVIKLAKAFNVPEVKILGGNELDTSTECFLAADKIIGEILDGKVRDDRSAVIYDVTNH